MRRPQDSSELPSLRVLQILAPAPIGGLESVVLSLARGLLEYGDEVGVVCLLESSEAHPFVAALDERRIPRRVLVTRGLLAERRQLAAWIAEAAPAVIHTHGYRADIQATGISRPGPGHVATAHGFTGGGWRMQLYEWLQCRALRSADAVVAVSHPLSDRLRNTGLSPDRIHVFPNARSRSEGLVERAQARAALGLPEARFVAGWVGRLSREKAPDVWLDAFARSSDPHLYTCLIGDGPERSALEQRARRSDLAGRVKFTGEISEVARLLRAFDVLVLSSRTEGTPMVLLEALDAGVPVIATAVGGVPDLLGDTEGWLVPPEDPVRLAAALESVRARPEEARSRAASASLRLSRDPAYPRWIEAHRALYRAVARNTSAS